MPDFFAFSKILPVLFYPLPLILLIIFIASWWLKKNVVRGIVQIAALMLWILASPWAADLALSWWETPRTNTKQLPEVSDAAIVLGGLSDAAVSTGQHLEFNQAAERITEAVALWKQGRVKYILITSGSGDLAHPEDVEAPGLAAWAASMGVPEKALIVESRSRNTRENATLSLPLVQAREFHSLVLITSAVHMPRSAAIFRKAGYTLEGRSLVLWPVDTNRSSLDFPFNVVPNSTSLSAVQGLLKEVVGYGVYTLQGYL